MLLGLKIHEKNNVHVILFITVVISLRAAGKTLAAVAIKNHAIITCKCVAN